MSKKAINPANLGNNSRVLCKSGVINADLEPYFGPGGGEEPSSPPPYISMGQDAELWVTEESAAAAWGLQRQTALKAMRDEILKEGEDWKREKRIIYISKKGAKKIAEKMGEDFEKMWSAAYEKEHVIKESVAILTKPRGLGLGHFPNKGLMMGLRSNGEKIKVWCRDSKFFRPTLTNGDPMLIEVKKQGERWEYQGKMPRSLGRW